MHELTARSTIDRPPQWASLQRQLLDLQSNAIDPIMESYLDDDGRPYWPQDNDYVGVDGHDDLYEGFYNWPLVYVLGGDDALLTAAKTAWEGIVAKFSTVETPFGHPMAVDEYEQCRDWFHQGEANQLLYNIGLADPYDPDFSDRAEHFAGFYLPSSDLENYDPDHRVVRAPQNGSMGPDYANPIHVTDQTTFGGYGPNYRWGTHGSPFRDIPGLETVADLQDPANRPTLEEAYEERCSRGDVPINLNITSLMTHAFLYTQDDTYRQWVEEYVDAWLERTEANDGIVPDNVGLSGEIGEHTGGTWYGGFYGWTWGGYHYVGIGPTVGAENAMLLTGEDRFLEMPRSLLRTLVDAGITRSAGPVNDTIHIPHKFGPPGDYHYDPGDVLREADGEVLWGDGWYEFKPLADVPYPMHLWYTSMDASDRALLWSLRDHSTASWKRVDPRPPGKHNNHDYPWLAYLAGEFPSYPRRVLEANYEQVQSRLELLRDDDTDPETYTEDYLRKRNPISAVPLLQLIFGAPQPIYYGGLLHARVRPFDAVRRRPGLPPDIAALVHRLTGDTVGIRLVNIGGAHREVVIQGGAYGEHTFSSLTAREQGVSVEPNAPAISVALPARSSIDLHGSMERFTNDPSYRFPWDK